MADTLEDLHAISTSEDNQPLFKPQLVLDPRLNVKSSLNFAVEKSGQQITQHLQKASSASVSGCQFELIVPSLSTIIDRHIMIQSRLTFTVTGTTLDGDYLVKYGVNCAPAPFAFQQLCSTISCSLNNSVYTMQANEVLAEVLRILPRDVLNEFSDTTPVVLDNYASWKDTMTGALDKTAVPKRNSPLNSNQSSFLYQEGRGSYNLVSITPDANPTTAGAHSTVVVIDVIEPLIMSPWLLSSSYKTPNGQGVYGVQGLSFNFQFANTTFSRAFRGVFGTGVGNTVVLNSVSADTSLYLTYITPHASLKLPARNCLDYMILNTYKSPVLINASPTPGATPTIVQSNTVTLSQIPDSIMVCVRRITGNRTGAYPDTWLPIQNVNINFNNVAGILSNCSQYGLWKLTKNNGLDVSWNNFKGYAVESPTISTISTAATNPATYAIGADAAAAKFVATCGSPVLLKMGSDIPLTSDWLAPSSIGNYSLQVSATVCDNTSYNGAVIPAIDLASYELVVICLNSSMIVCSLGSASSYSGLLTKAQVLEASVQTPVSGASVARVYGGGAMNSLAGMPSHSGGKGYSAGGKGKMEGRFV